MEEQGRITPAERPRRAGAAGGRPGAARGRSAGAPSPPGSWRRCGASWRSRSGEDLYDERLRIHTTLDVGAQTAAEEELDRQLRAIEGGELGRFPARAYAAALSDGREGTPYLQGAVVALEVAPATCWPGWAAATSATRASTACGRRARQAGSAFKPFVYAAALASGRTLSQTLIDEPMRVPLDRRRVLGAEELRRRLRRRVTLRDALVRSKNVPTVRLANDVGLPDVADAGRAGRARAAGPEQPSMALGHRVGEPAGAGRGLHRVRRPGRRGAPAAGAAAWSAATGSVLWQAEPPRAQARARAAASPTWSPTSCARRSSAARAPAVARAGFRAPAAGKTGTTNDGADAWFVGYTPDVVAAVWIGFDEARPIMNRATGGRLAAPVWGKVMRRLYRQRKVPKAWAAPSDVVDMRIDGVPPRFALSFDCAGPQETTPSQSSAGATRSTACPVPGGTANLEPTVSRPMSASAEACRPCRRWGRGATRSLHAEGRGYLGPSARRTPQRTDRQNHAETLSNAVEGRSRRGALHVTENASM